MCTLSNNITVTQSRDRPIMLIFYLLCYAAVLINFTCYAQNYAQEKELCLVYFYCLYTNLHELIADSLERLFY